MKGSFFCTCQLCINLKLPDWLHVRRNVSFPGKTMASKIVVPSTFSFKPPSPFSHTYPKQLGVCLVLDVWESEQEEFSTAPSRHKRQNKKEEDGRKETKQNPNTHNLSDEKRDSNTQHPQESLQKAQLL